MGQTMSSQGFVTIVHSQRVKTRSTSTETGGSKPNNACSGAAAQEQEWWGRLINGLSEKRG